MKYSTNDAPTAGNALQGQSGREGEPFSFTLPADTFVDIDVADTLTMSARLTDGAPLPNWLAFEDGTFSGTPGAADGGEYLIRLTATDGAGATAAADFRLLVIDSLPTSNRIVGTRGNDVLQATQSDDFIAGRAGKDCLLGGSGDDVLSGGRGNDKLQGGPGRDVYIHKRRGGQDTIHEAGSADEIDVLRFDEEIERHMVRVTRLRDDLVLDVSGPHGSVTVTDWFSSSAQRVERIEFADGTVWDEEAIRKAVRHPHDGDHHGWIHHHDKDDERLGHATNEGSPHRDDRSGRDGVAAISEHLARSASFDFEALALELERSDKRETPLTAQQIERQWASVERYVSGLAHEVQPDDISPAEWRNFSAANLPRASGFGFEASIAAARGPDNLKSLEGLSEGFRRL